MAIRIHQEGIDIELEDLETSFKLNDPPMKAILLWQTESFQCPKLVWPTSCEQSTQYFSGFTSFSQCFNPFIMLSVVRTHWAARVRGKHSHHRPNFILPARWGLKQLCSSIAWITYSQNVSGNGRHAAGAFVNLHVTFCRSCAHHEAASFKDISEEDKAEAKKMGDLMGEKALGILSK